MVNVLAMKYLFLVCGKILVRMVVVAGFLASMGLYAQTSVGESPGPTVTATATAAASVNPLPEGVVAAPVRRVSLGVLSIGGIELEFQLEGKTADLPLEYIDPIALLVAEGPAKFEASLVSLVSEFLRFKNVSLYKDSKKPNRYVLAAVKQKRVADISIYGLGFMEESQYKRVLKTKVGQPFLLDDLSEDVSRLKLRLNERGYMNASVQSPVVEQSSSGDIRIIFEVVRGTPCRVAEVVMQPDKGIFDFITSPVDPGSLCDRIAIEDALEREHTNLRTAGFLDAVLKFVSLDYTPDKERAVVRLFVDRGRRTRVEVVNLASGAVSDEVAQGKSGLSPAELAYISEDELKSEILAAYYKRGYMDAVLSGPNQYTTQSGDEVFRYFVQPGQQIFVGKVEFKGELPYPYQEMLDRLGLVPGFFSGRVPFVQQDMEQLKEKLLSLYFEEGFVDARVEGPSVSFSSVGKVANLVFRVAAGPRYVVRDFTILGKPKELEGTNEIVEEIFPAGSPVSKTRLRNLEEEMKIALLKYGFAYATVKAEPNLFPVLNNKRPVQLILTITPGQQVRIGQVFAEGELYGKGDRAILESGLLTGDLFTPEAIEAARLRVLRHDLYGNVQIEPLNPNALVERKSIVDLVMRTQGRGGYSLGLGPGYGTRNGYRFTVDYAKNNLTRDGLRLNSTAALSQEKQQKSFSDTKQLLGRKISVGLVEPLFRVGSYVSPLDLSALSGLEVASQPLSNRFFETIETRASYKPYFWDIPWNFYVKFGHEWSRVIGSGYEPIEALDRPSLRIHEVTLGANIDTRNSVEWPTKGMNLDIYSSHARFGFFSEVQYDRAGLDLSKYYPIWGRFSGALGFGVSRIGNVVNNRSQTVMAPSSRRSSFVGRSVVRGFPEGNPGLGPLIWLDLQAPRNNLDLDCSPTLRAIGATNLGYLKSEVRYRTNWFNDMIGFAWFVDT